MPLDDWKVYLRWKTINDYAPVLTKPSSKRILISTASTCRDSKRWSRAGSAA